MRIKKKKKSLPLGFLRSNVDTLVNQNVSHSTTAAFLNPLERRGEKSRLICWTAAARSSPYKNGWVQENSRLPEHKAFYFVGIWWSTFCCDRYQENFFFFYEKPESHLLLQVHTCTQVWPLYTTKVITCRFRNTYSKTTFLQRNLK